jgi:lipopolysaccharide transport system ATP-binding protein
MTRPMIEIYALSKRYHLNARRQQGERTLTTAVASAVSSTLAAARRSVGGEEEGDYVWALRDVTFDIQPGEAIGVIGHNGAGKSTLLQIMSRLTLPTSGYIRARGRIASMLGLGVGFSPDLTGRENVLLNGMMLGMTRAGVRQRFGDIVDFSGLGDFIDVPVRQYSSGMKLRLGFSVLAVIEPEILLLDEVLSVGDAEFRERSSKRMEELIGSGRTVVLVTHSRREVERLCKRVVRLEHGRVADIGDVSARRAAGRKKKAIAAAKPRRVPEGPPVGAVSIAYPSDQPMNLREACTLGPSGEVSGEFERSMPITVRVRYKVEEPLAGAHVFCRLETHDRQTVLCTGDMDADAACAGERRPGEYVTQVTIPSGLLEAGRYWLSITLGRPWGERFERHRRLLQLSIVDRSSVRRHWYIDDRPRPGFIGLDLPWRCIGADPWRRATC